MSRASPRRWPGAAKRLGLDPELAARSRSQTLVGTAAMAATGEAMADIARRVASPNGTTERGWRCSTPPTGSSGWSTRMLAAAIARGRQLADEAAARS